MEELLEWKICSQLDHHKLERIKLLHVLQLGESAYYVDPDDQVYRLRSGTKFGNTTESKVEVLCGKNIICFERGSGYTLVLSADGRAYGWGENAFGQLAIGNRTNTGTKLQLCSQLLDYKIVKIKCGYDHTLAVTDRGEALAWGSSAEGQCASDAESQSPAVVMRDVVDISAIRNSSCFLTEDGRVFVCGYNQGGILGADSAVNTVTPTEIIIEDAIVKQVMMGQNHILALSDDGRVLAWGKNDKGQLGTGSTVSTSTPASTAPVFENEIEEKFVEIAAHPELDISAAITINRQVYIWGDETGSSTPMKTSLRSLDSVFARLEKTEGTYRDIRVEGVNVTENVINAFDDPDQSDCQFVIEEQKIYATKGILKLRSEYLRTMLNDEWSESNDTITINNYSYQAYYAFLYFLYSDQIEINDDSILELLELAHEVMNEDLLRQCVERIRRQLSSDNICDVFVVARRLDLIDLLNDCRLLARHDLTQILMSESYERLTPAQGYEFTWFVARNELKHFSEKEDNQDKDIKT